MAKWEVNKEQFTILDGGLGTMLQAAGLPVGERPEKVALDAPDVLTGIHKQYIEAGAQIVCANTFGANRHKLAGTALELAEVIAAAVGCAKEACKGTSAIVALDVGPIGELLEPGGTLTFEEAYDTFTEVVQAGVKAGADLIMIETMTDLYETKAAVLAAKENSDLPVFASMSFEENGRTFAGVPVEAMAVTLSPLGVDALGINCSLGPDEIRPMAERLCASTSLPVFVKPNAGLPDPATGGYDVGPAEFERQMLPYIKMGISMVGGCCGTTPETIKRLATAFAGKTPVKKKNKLRNLVCSGTRVQYIDGVTPIGERLNPTGKKRLQEALRNGDMGYLQTQAVAQQQDGALVLDVNVGTPGADEVALLPQAVKAIQAVTDLPLQLDSANPKALEAALRVYNGKAIVNSTSGEAEKMAEVLPLCKKYGAAVVGLTLDEEGIPATAEGRFAIAECILNKALEHGIPKEDIYIDNLVLTASAEQSAAAQTLQAVSMVKNKLGLKTVLGVSNVSFGLPNRPLLNQTFLTMAMAAGLDMPILNPAAEGMMGAIAAFNVLTSADEKSAQYIKKYSEQPTVSIVPTQQDGLTLDKAIERGLKAEAGRIAGELLAAGSGGLDIVNQYLMPALDKVGLGFEKGTLFLPQLLAAADAAGAAFDKIKASYGEAAVEGPPVVLATVKGDIHDIGKNIVKVLLENYGFSVIDLGRDVPPDKVVEAAQKSGAKLVGLSALMTTTLPSMQQTIEQLHKASVACKVVVGGAVLTESYATAIGADYYAKDAKVTVDIARELHEMK